MLQLFNQYVTDSITTAYQTYLINPLIDWGTHKVKEVAIKKVSQNIANKLGESVIGKELVRKDNNEVKVHWLRKLSKSIGHIPQNIQYACEGQLFGSVTKGFLSVTNTLYPTTAGTLLRHIGPKMAKLSRIKCEHPDFGKEVVVGAISQSAGGYMQKYMDSALPELAPHAGYVAYGLSYGLTNLTLNNAYYGACKIMAKVKPF